MDDAMKVGFTYNIKHYRKDGLLLSEEESCNLVPLAGINYMLNSAFQGASPSSLWYIGLYSGNYTPQISDDLPTLVGTAIEYVDYSQSTRQLFNAANATTGTLTNVANLARINATVATTLYGGFICNNATKGNTSGLAISAVRFSSAKPLDVGDYVDIQAAISLANI